MAKISFYELQARPIEAALPGLLEKVLEAGMRAVVRTPDQSVSDLIDRELWTYDPASFLPHGTERSGHAEDQPVYITSSDEVPNGAEALVVVNDADIGDAENFRRCFLMFDGRVDSVLDLSRRRWKKFGDSEHELAYWRQGPGGWEQVEEP